MNLILSGVLVPLELALVVQLVVGDRSVLDRARFVVSALGGGGRCERSGIEDKI